MLNTLSIRQMYFDHYSESTKQLWDYICKKRLVYAIVLSCWLLPVLINLARVFEQGITFKPGKTNQTPDEEVGYLCYAYEGRQRVLFTTMSYAINLVNDIAVFVVILISNGISIFAFKNEVQKMNDAEVMERDELKRLRYNIISKLKERKLGAMVFCICLCYILLRLPLTIIGNESIHYWNFKFAFCMFLYNLQFTIHSVIYPIGGKDFAICYLDMLKKIFPCCFHNHSTNANMSFHIPLHLKASY